MGEYLERIWGFEYAVVPCLLAYAVFDLPILLRRITRRVYVPIYFAFFPYGFSDELYARYFDEDHYYRLGGGLQESEVKNARLKIIWVSVLSLALTMSLSPFITALFSYYFLSTDQQQQFFYTLGGIKLLLLMISLKDLHWKYRITDKVNIGWVALIYLGYWIAILTFYDRGLKWIAEKDALGGFAVIANSLLDFFVFDIGVGIVFVSVIGFLLPWRLTDGTARPIDRAGRSDG